MPLPDRVTKTGILTVAEANDPHRLADSIKALARGSGANWRKVALTPNDTSTTVLVIGLSPNAIAFVHPQDADAKAVDPYVSAVAAGSITITHTSSATPGDVGVEWRQ